MSVNTWTYLLWEQDRHVPTVRYYPVIFQFLGFDPFPSPTTLPQRLAAKRRHHGLTIKEAARRVGVDEGTFRRWESGEWNPRMSGEVVQRFLDMPAPAPDEPPFGGRPLRQQKTR
jgi:hypothetical protein